MKECEICLESEATRKLTKLIQTDFGPMKIEYILCDECAKVMKGDADD